MQGICQDKKMPRRILRGRIYRLGKISIKRCVLDGMFADSFTTIGAGRYRKILDCIFQDSIKRNIQGLMEKMTPDSVLPLVILEPLFSVQFRIIDINGIGFHLIPSWGSFLPRIMVISIPCGSARSDGQLWNKWNKHCGPSLFCPSAPRNSILVVF